MPRRSAFPRTLVVTGIAGGLLAIGATNALAGAPSLSLSGSGGTGTLTHARKAAFVDIEDGGCDNMNVTKVEFRIAGSVEEEFSLYRNGVPVDEADSETDSRGRGKIVLGAGHGIDLALGDVLSIRRITVTDKRAGTFVPASGDLVAGTVTAASMVTPAGEAC